MRDLPRANIRLRRPSAFIAAIIGSQRSGNHSHRFGVIFSTPSSIRVPMRPRLRQGPRLSVEVANRKFQCAPIDTAPLMASALARTALTFPKQRLLPPQSLVGEGEIHNGPLSLPQLS
jgi:hypothetical protein